MANQGSGRRWFLKLGGVSLVISAVSPKFLSAAADSRLERLRGLRSQSAHKTLINIYMGGGQDGLNVVVPTEPSTEYPLYQSYRPGIAVDKTDPNFGVLNSDFGLNPVMSTGIFDLWNRGMVAVLPTVGYPTSPRSHFQSLKYIDSGKPQNGIASDGWMNRYMQQLDPAPTDPLRGIAFIRSTPLNMLGSAPVLTLSNLNQLKVSSVPDRNTKYLEGYRRTYTMPTPERPNIRGLVDSGQALVAAIQAIPATLPTPSQTYPASDFGEAMKSVAKLMKTDLFEIEFVNVQATGWDTHTNQVGQFNGRLGDFSDAVRAFVDDIGPSRMQETLLVSFSEFGRTARENGGAGTDHGNAWTSFVIADSSRINPGLYMGPTGWPGLGNLRENRDLAHTVDFRDLYAEILTKHMGVAPGPDIFPNWVPAPSLNFLV